MGKLAQSRRQTEITKKADSSFYFENKLFMICGAAGGMGNYPENKYPIGTAISTLTPVLKHRQQHGLLRTGLAVLQRRHGKF
ncbi:MAG TPA: hypothetical protein DCW46_09885 [Desulfotomaculum sp.]|nr:hypothetical protein [Desulfotomaculum sp.]